MKNGHDHGSKSTLHRFGATHHILFAWTPECDLGIPIIDEQHRGIVATINSLHYAVYHNLGGHMILPVVGMVNEYTRIHFEVEEKILTNCNYPDLASHRQLHYKLVQKMAEIGSESMVRRDPYPFLNFLKGWWHDHICGEDRKFRGFWREDETGCGVIPSELAYLRHPGQPLAPG